jgi:hypothetical protein
MRGGTGRTYRRRMMNAPFTRLLADAAADDRRREADFLRLTGSVRGPRRRPAVAVRLWNAMAPHGNSPRTRPSA